MKLKWKCPNCGALHGSQEALMLLLSKAFVPVTVDEEQPKPIEKIVKHAPIPKPKAEPKEELDEFDEEPEEEKEEDLSLE